MSPSIISVSLLMQFNFYGFRTDKTCSTLAMFTLLYPPDCFGLTFFSLEQSEKRCGILTSPS